MVLSGPHIRKRYLLSLLFVIILVILFFPIHAFVVINEKKGDHLFIAPVSPRDRFEIHYIHSVEHMDVVGVFLINDHYKIASIETIFPSYGAGMPSRVESKNIVFNGKMMRVKHRNIELADLRLFISHITRQRIIFKDLQIDLYKKIRDGGIAVITVKRRPLLDLLISSRS